MRRVLALLASILLFPSLAIAQTPDCRLPDPWYCLNPSGLIIIRQGNQTTWSVGGVLLPRTVKVVTQTPEGKDVAYFRFPSLIQAPYPAPTPTGAPANLQIEIPDPHGLVYVDGELVRGTGTTRQMLSPKLSPGKAYPLRVRGTYVVGDNFLIEDKQVVLRAGETTAFAFDGKQALSVPMKKEWIGPPPQAK